MSRRSSSSAVLVFAVLALVLLPALARAQSPYLGFFGKNKVQYRDFKWKVYHSPHFDVYYYTDQEELLQKVVSFAESAYDQLSQEFDYQIQKPTSLIFYETHSAFEQNNEIKNFIPEGIGAFATDLRKRMFMPVDLSDPDLWALMLHELTHIFQYHILFSGSLGKALTSGAGVVARRAAAEETAVAIWSLAAVAALTALGLLALLLRRSIGSIRR